MKLWSHLQFFFVFITSHFRFTVTCHVMSKFSISVPHHINSSFIIMLSCLGYFGFSLRRVCQGPRTFGSGRPLRHDSRHEMQVDILFCAVILNSPVYDQMNQINGEFLVQNSGTEPKIERSESEGFIASQNQFVSRLYLLKCFWRNFWLMIHIISINHELIIYWLSN